MRLLCRGLNSSPRLASRPAPVLLPLRRDERSQALVVLRARRAPLQVLAHPGDRGVGLALAEFELDVAIEQLEALLSADLEPVGTEQAPDQPVGKIRVHLVTSVGSGSASKRSPCSASTARSFRRAS